MTEGFKPKTSVSDEVLPTFSFRKNNFDNGTPCEVFRNNTTAVEVIIKEVPKPKNKLDAPNLQSITIKRLEGEIDRLKYELKKSNTSIEKSRKCFKNVLTEIRKQLDLANERDLDNLSKNLTLQLENEKLKCLLDSKTQIVDKVKKELNNLRRVIKIVVKGMRFAPEVTENVSYTSDLEYDDFESDLKKDVRVKLATKLFDGTATFDTNVSKEESFEKRPF